MKNLLLSIIFLALSAQAFSDDFASYSAIIDNYGNYTIEQRDDYIRDLISYESDDIEKHYLLGMLYTIQGMEIMTNVAKSRATKPKIEEVLADPTVSRYFADAESHYDVVDAKSPGYKYLYCKYAELYRYSFNEKGLVSITKRIGSSDQTKSVQSCKTMIEEIAVSYAQYGRAEFAKAIFSTAINNWNPYPEFMLEAMGDLNKALGDHASAKKWWQRCANESNGTRKERCNQKSFK